MASNFVPFGIGFVTGLRSMSATAALIWAASLRRTQVDWLPTSDTARLLALAAALGEIIGDKLPFAPDRRIPPSMLVRLAVGAAGGMALADPGTPRQEAAFAGMAGAVVGTFLGRAARGRTTRSRADWARALAEDAVATGMAAMLVRSAAPARVVGMP